MSLQEFKEELEEIGGLTDSIIEENQLIVKYFGNASNYSTKRGKVRQKYPSIVQVDRDIDSSGHVTLIYEIEK